MPSYLHDHHPFLHLYPLLCLLLEAPFLLVASGGISAVVVASLDLYKTKSQHFG